MSNAKIAMMVLDRQLGVYGSMQARRVLAQALAAGRKTCPVQDDALILEAYPKLLKEFQVQRFEAKLHKAFGW